MAKAQKRSNREVRKPKQPKAKVETVTRSFLSDAMATAPKPVGGPKRGSR
ncbi:MAG: hypothetical protein ACK53I_02050 [Phenylobacterium sp.]|jgi:hypothetical protein